MNAQEDECRIPKYRPSPPGDTLQDLLIEQDITVKQVAEHIGVERKVIADIIYGEAQITQEIADGLEPIFEVSATFWLRRQELYDAERERLKTRRHDAKQNT